MVTVSSFEQEGKASFTVRVSVLPAGKVTDLRFALRKAFSPIEVTLFGIVKSMGLSDLMPKFINAWLPMVITLSGIVRDPTAQHALKAEGDISVMLSGMVISFSAVHILKAPFPI